MIAKLEQRWWQENWQKLKPPAENASNEAFRNEHCLRLFTFVYQTCDWQLCSLPFPHLHSTTACNGGRLDMRCIEMIMALPFTWMSFQRQKKPLILAAADFVWRDTKADNKDRYIMLEWGVAFCSITLVLLGFWHDCYSSNTRVFTLCLVVLLHFQCSGCSTLNKPHFAKHFKPLLATSTGGSCFIRIYMLNSKLRFISTVLKSTLIPLLH